MLESIFVFTWRLFNEVSGHAEWKKYEDEVLLYYRKHLQHSFANILAYYKIKQNNIFVFQVN